MVGIMFTTYTDTNGQALSIAQKADSLVFLIERVQVPTPTTGDEPTYFEPQFESQFE